MNARVKPELFELLEQQSRSGGDNTRWLGAFLFVVIVHGGLAAVLLHKSPTPAADLGTGTPMVVELADFVSAPRAAVAEAADVAEPIPTEPVHAEPEQVAKADEAPPPPVEPVPAPAEPEAITEAKPLPTQTVAKAKSSQETPPAPTKKPEAQTTSSPPAPASTASSRQQEARAAARAAQQRESQLASLQESWQGTVNAHLERYKRYPHTARSRSQEGIARLRFQLDRRGRVTESELSQSSGHFLLDREAQAVLKRAQPLPPPPEDIAGERIELVWQVEFALH